MRSPSRSRRGRPPTTTDNPRVPCSRCGRRLFSASSAAQVERVLCRSCRCVEPKQCAHCGQPFVGWKANGVYCSIRCTTESRVVRQRICEVCGTEFRATYTGQRTCGRKCGVLINRKRLRWSISHCIRKGLASRLYYASCWACRGVIVSGSPIDSACCSSVACRDSLLPVLYVDVRCDMCSRKLCRERHKSRRFCSDHCRSRWHSSGRVRRVWMAGRCMACEVSFVAGSNRGDRYCSSECARRHRKEVERRRHRAAITGVPRDRYTLSEIAVRDGFRCGLCKRRVRMDLIVPHPRAPTVDHIVPLSKGGSDLRTNLQLAHFICNSRKSDRGSYQQTLLVG
jgi:5-methylcytosine-specific restriction endonuclease McrA